MNELLPRHLSRLAAEILAAFPVLVIEGARQVGKSTFAHMVTEGRPSRFFTLDDVQVAQAVREDPRAFIDQAVGHTVIIDEIQRAPELILEIKRAVDARRDPGRFVLTGSSDLLRLERTPDSLAGRATTLTLHGLSQGEVEGVTEDFVADLVAGRPPTEVHSTVSRRDYAEILARGGYPEVRSLTPRLRGIWIDSYLDRITQRDAREVLGLTQPDRLRALLRLLAANQAGELVKARFAEAANIPASTITAYLDALKTLFLLTEIPPWTPNLTRREIGRGKATVTDSALAMRSSGVTAEQISDLQGGELLGPLLEGLVVAELIKQQGWSSEEFRLYHYRDRNGPEVDVVIELASGAIFALEIKASQTYRAAHFDGLRQLEQKAGKRFLGGIVLGTSDVGYRYSQRLWGLPIAALWQRR